MVSYFPSKKDKKQNQGQSSTDSQAADDPDQYRSSTITVSNRSADDQSAQQDSGSSAIGAGNIVGATWAFYRSLIIRMPAGERMRVWPVIAKHIA